ncbi:helical backbone metal receptor [Bdellovibrionota bacterium FG-1]
MRFFKTAKKRFSGNLWICWLLVFPSVFASAHEVIDATGAHVEVSDWPTRVVTLAPSLGELVADLNEKRVDRIVGVSEYTDFPVSLKKISSVGAYTRFNIEKVVSLKPDLVLATLDGNPKDQVLHLREIKIPVIVVDTSSFTQVAQSIKLVAQALGTPAEGDKMARIFSEGLVTFRSLVRARTTPKSRVFLQVGGDPLVTVGQGAFLNDALEAVGAINIYGDVVAHYPTPSLEDVIRRKPDVILVLALNGDQAVFRKMATQWSRFSTLPAVKNGKVRVLKDDAVLRPTRRLLEGLALLEKAVYGER